jgi:hypothetical protein
VAPTYLTSADLGRHLWVPFNLPETRIQPGVEQLIHILQLSPGQRATLVWLSVNLIRVLVLTAAPVKLNPGYNSVYAGLFGGGADRLTGAPGQPLVYAGTDLPGTVGVFPAQQAWPLDEPDTYAVMLVNNLTNPPIDASASGAWLVHT